MDSVEREQCHQCGREPDECVCGFDPDIIDDDFDMPEVDTDDLDWDYYPDE